MKISIKNIDGLARCFTLERPLLKIKLEFWYPAEQGQISRGHLPPGSLLTKWSPVHVTYRDFFSKCLFLSAKLLWPQFLINILYSNLKCIFKIHSESTFWPCFEDLFKGPDIKDRDFFPDPQIFFLWIFPDFTPNFSKMF